MKKILRISWLLLFLAGVGVSAGILLGWLRSSIVGGQVYEYHVSPGVSARTVVADLDREVRVRWPGLLLRGLQLCRIDRQLQAGTYRFPPHSRIADLFHKFHSGEVVRYSWTLVEGARLRDLVMQMSSRGILVTKTFLPIGDPLEGKLLPETYDYPENAHDVDLIERAHRAMNEYLDKAWSERDPAVPWTKDQALIVASLIEKETARSAEKPLISAVILKRWKIRMPLQIDSTIVYGLGERYTGKLTVSALKQKGPYNTYTHCGLPPTPIAMPGRESIWAALHPARTQALYFVATPSGTHRFAETLKAHHRNIREINGSQRTAGKN